MRNFSTRSDQTRIWYIIRQSPETEEIMQYDGYDCPRATQ